MCRELLTSICRQHAVCPVCVTSDLSGFIPSPEGDGSATTNSTGGSNRTNGVACRQEVRTTGSLLGEVRDRCWPKSRCMAPNHRSIRNRHFATGLSNRFPEARSGRSRAAFPMIPSRSRSRKAARLALPACALSAGIRCAFAPATMVSNCEARHGWPASREPCRCNRPGHHGQGPLKPSVDFDLHPSRLRIGPEPYVRIVRRIARMTVSSRTAM